MAPPSRWPLGLVDVAGGSMSPALVPGDTVLVRWRAPARAGRVVVVVWPGHPGVLVVKRVLARVGDGWWLEGDSPEDSEDSRRHGPVPDASVQGRVLLRVPRGRWSRRAQPRARRSSA